MTQTPEYAIEVRDINGKRTMTEFATREDFYRWAADVQDGLHGNPDEMQIMLITQRISIGDTSSNAILYSSLGGVETIDLEWEDLVGYLA